MRKQLWVIGLALVAGVPACGDDSAGDTSGGGGSDAGVGDALPALDGGSACLSAEDRDTTADLDAELQSCVKALLTSGKGPSDADFADAVAACLVAETGLSPACSACHAAFADCSADQCLAACIADPEATECSDCRCGKSAALDCIGAFVQCSGLPDDTCS